ncbi:MAG: hypothetical protein M3Y59_05410 [Myxococcota bacterium]|nr:hypothetical protein [Myxococcota bacterium]
MSKRQRLGELLISLGVIDGMQLQAALGHQRQWGVPLGRALLEKRFCTEDQILAALAKQTGVPTIEINLATLDRSLAALLPQRIAEQHRAVPLRQEGARGEVLRVALGGPANLASVDEVRSATGIARIIPYLAKDSEIDRALDILYRGIAPPEASAPQGVTYDSLPPPGANVQGEEEFDFGEDTPGPGSSPAVTSALDDLMGIGGQPSAGVLSRPAPPTTPPAPPADPLASLHPPPLPRKLVSKAPPAPPHPAPNTPPPVIIYGWPAAASELLRTTLAEGGIASRIVEGTETLQTVEEDVIISPLPLIEAVVAQRKAQLTGQVIVAVKTPESDLHRAQRVGAKGYLATPVDGDLLLRAVKRCRRG